jgi:hypothetical protein
MCFIKDDSKEQNKDINVTREQFLQPNCVLLEKNIFFSIARYMFRPKISTSELL